MKYAGGMMRRWIFGFGAAAILAVVLSCSDDGDSGGAGVVANGWWEPLLAYVPADSSREELYIADFGEARERRGLSPEDTRDCDARLETFTDHERDVFIELVGLVPIYDQLLMLIPTDQETVIGFDACQVERIAVAGGRPQTLSVIEASVPTAPIPNLLASRGYQAREYAGRTYLSIGGDYEVIDQGSYNLLNRVFVDQNIVIRAPADDLIEAALGGDRDEEAVSIAGALSEFQAALFPGDAYDFSSFQSDLIAQAGGFVPKEQVEAKIQEIVEQYEDWERLPRPGRIALAHNRAMNGDDQMKVALLYEQPSEADDASHELKRRLAVYKDPLAEERFCNEPAEVSVTETNGVWIVVALCKARRATQWLDFQFQGNTLFLVEELPDP